MNRALRVNHVLITFFALQSGLFKVLGGITNTGDPAAWWETDNHIFSHLGLTVPMVLVFGLIQASGGAGLLFRKTRRAAAVLVACCNLFATAGLFAAKIQPFGVVSLLFVAMALLELKRPIAPAGGEAQPATVQRPS
jgi:hypothetical protein